MNALDEICAIRGAAAPEPCRDVNPYRVLLWESGTCLAAYYFSCPVKRESDAMPVDRAWRTGTDGGAFRGANALVSVRENRLELSNSYGKAVVAFGGDVRLEPTYNGAAAHVSGHAVELEIETDRPRSLRRSGNCIALMQGDFTPFFTISGIFGRAGARAEPLTVAVKEERNNGCRAEIRGSENVSEMLFEADLHAPKLAMDTAVERANPDRNDAFGASAFPGVGEPFGEQWLYSRLEPLYFADLGNFEVNRATWFVRFHGLPGTVRAWRMELPWCSFGSNWNARVAPGASEVPVRAEHHYLAVDYTRILREIFAHPDRRDPGVVLKGDDGYTALSTGDCYLFPQILEIKLTKKE